MGIPAIAVVLVLVIGNIISTSIADDFARRLARQYSIEAAANFQLGVTPHFVLMQQVSRSTTIARWLANENDHHLKTQAFEEIMGYVTYSPETRLMFTVYESMQGYDFHVNLTREDFLPWGTLAGGEVSQWFYDTRDAEMPYVMNVQRERPEVVEDDIVLFIWSNHRVYYYNDFVGVVTVGFHFDQIFDAVFGNYDISYIRGYLIDQYGLVRVDSAGLLDVHELGIPTPVQIPDAIDNPTLADSVNEHLGLMTGGIFTQGLNTCEAIPLTDGPFLYASITPIINTAWSVVVLSNHAGIFDGRYIPIIFSGFVIMAISASLGNFVVARTVFRAKKEIIDVETLEESNRAKTRFLARMSHEIRTPIAAVIGISEIQLRNTNNSKHIEESFLKIHDSGILLLNIVNDILDFSKIESGKMQLLNEKYDVASLISDVAQLHLMYIEHKKIDFHLDADENIPMHLVGDYLRIKQILNNLISNAFKYTEAGTVSLSVGHENITEDSVSLVITIADTGYGMTAEQLESLKTSEYMRFHEQESNTSGTGLGISIVYSLAHLMDADVKFVSEVRKGTTVVVRIPQQRSGTEVLGNEIATRLQNFESGTWTIAEKFNFVPEMMPYGKILVVDDVDANLFVARGLLAFYNLLVDTCMSGQEAIDKVSQGNQYDIIFMDHMMPVMDGDETMHILRDMGYDYPIVAFTANVLAGQEEEFIKSGFDDFISKPIQTTRLNELLHKFVKDKKPVSQDEFDSFFDSANEELQKRFAKDQKNTFADIKSALKDGNVETAHRLAHSLKSVAGMIFEESLAEAASQLELTLKNNSNPTESQLSELEHELTTVLNRIDNSYAVSKNHTFNSYGFDFQKLVTLLESGNAACLELVDELRKMPETAIIAAQIEDFDFEAALKNVRILQSVFDI